jgi:hypothetical protein
MKTRPKHRTLSEEIADAKRILKSLKTVRPRIAWYDNSPGQGTDAAYAGAGVDTAITSMSAIVERLEFARRIKGRTRA